MQPSELCVASGIATLRPALRVAAAHLCRKHLDLIMEDIHARNLQASPADAKLLSPLWLPVAQMRAVSIGCAQPPCAPPTG